jgi:hypothetical protein
MTKFDNKFVSSTPKTYTVSELRDTTQQPVKKSNLSAAARSKVISRSGSNYLSENQGYGPCYVCSKPEKETYLKVACPVVSCTDRNPKNWYHTWCFGSRMKISNRGNLRCEGCSTSGKVGYWRFICSGHGGTPEYTTTGAFRRALGIVLGSDDCDEVITDLGAYIADPKHKDEWFR